jgi:hypothetical protein
MMRHILLKWQEWGKQPALDIKVVLHTKSAVSMFEYEGRRDRLCSIMCVCQRVSMGLFIEEHVHIL